MAAINFYLRKDSKNKTSISSMINKVTFQNTAFKKAINISISLKHWNDTRQRVKPNLKSEKYNFYNEHNLKIDKLERRANEIFNRYQLDNKLLNKESFLKEMDSYGEGSLEQKLFLEQYSIYIEHNRPLKAKRIVMGHETTKGYLKDFEETLDYKITLTNFNLAFFDKLKNYSFSKKKISDNYLNTITSKIKAFMN